jgi:hypothetical protein
VTRNLTRSLVLMCAVLGPVVPALAQDDEAGLDPRTSAQAREILGQAVEAMGGRRVLQRITTAVLDVESPGALRERHSLRMDGRYLHYSCRRPSGRGFQVVLARGLTFLCDCDSEGDPLRVEDLSEADAQEGAYERDTLFMPLLLLSLLEDPSTPLDYRGTNSEGEEVIRVLIRPPFEDDPGRPFLVRMRFDPDTHLLKAAMGNIPCGRDTGLKRWFTYDGWEEVARGIILPTRYGDQRGEDMPVNEYGVSWQLNREFAPTMFTRPHVPAREDGDGEGDGGGD